MYFRLELADPTDTVQIWDTDGTIKYTLNAGNLEEIISEDEMISIMPRVDDVVAQKRILLTNVPQTSGGMSFRTVVEDVTATLVGRDVFLAHTPYTLNSILEVMIKQTAINNWTADLATNKISFGTTVNVTQTPITVKYTYLE